MKKIIFSTFIILFVSALNAQEKLFLSNIPSSSYGIEALKDIKIVPSSAYASSSQNGEGIEKAIDGDYSTIYHSSWGGSASPITLRFDFPEVDMNYLIYHPRMSGSNGNFGKLQIFYVAGDNPEKIKLGDFDFEGSKLAKSVKFPGTLERVKSIEFLIESGSTDSSGNLYASCSEMEFYGKNPELSSYGNIFADPLMTTLKAEVSMDDINRISNPFIRSVATSIYLGYYDTNYRVNNFHAYLNLSSMSKELMVSAYNKYENPTGIYFSKGSHLLIAENIPTDRKVYLVIPDFRYTEGGGSLNSKSFPLENGINIIDVTAWDGLGYISYFSETPEQDEPVSIHFMKGYVHGYFDITKNNNDDWNNLLENANKYPVMDAVGRRAHVVYPVEAYKNYAWGQGVELVNGYDTVIAYQQRMLGWEKYNKLPDNKVLVRVNYHYFMYKDGDGASFENGTMDYVSSPTRMFTDNWGITHEIGHIHQYKFNNWHGMGEVSVNLPNIFVGHRLLNSPGTGNYREANYNNAYNSIVAAGIPYLKYNGEGSIDHNFGRLVPFAQLYHYFAEIGYDDFYPDLNEALRNTTENTSDWTMVDYQLNFVKKACEVSQLNLLSFFDKWGFLYYTDNGRETFEVGDYAGKRVYSLPKAKVDAFIAEIESLGYPEPDVDVTLVKPNGGRIQ